MSVGVGRIFESVCLSVCPQHPKVFKLGVGNELGILEVILFWGSKVTGSITLHNNTSFPTTVAIFSHSLGGDYNVTTVIGCH